MIHQIGSPTVVAILGAPKPLAALQCTYKATQSWVILGLTDPEMGRVRVWSPEIDRILSLIQYQRFRFRATDVWAVSSVSALR